MNLDAETCECKDHEHRQVRCLHFYAALIYAAKKRCRRATTERPERRHGQPSGSPRTPTGRPEGNTPAGPPGSGRPGATVGGRVRYRDAKRDVAIGVIADSGAVVQLPKKTREALRKRGLRRRKPVRRGGG